MKSRNLAPIASPGRIARALILAATFAAAFPAAAALTDLGTTPLASGSTGAVKDGWDGILKWQLDIRLKPCNFVEILPRLTEK